MILSFESEVEGEDWMESEGWLASLIPLRSEILRGDLRCLYLSWLLCAQNAEIDDDEPEPCVPLNLGELSASDSSFADFLAIDDDLIEVAARASSRSVEDAGKRTALESWARGLPEAEKNALLLRVLDDVPQLGAELRIRFAQETRAKNSPEVASELGDRRTASELLSAAEELSEGKRRQAAEKAAAEKARIQQEKTAARERYLNDLAQKADKVWLKVEDLISTTRPARYDEAAKLLVDLRDLAVCQGKVDDFRLRYGELREEHANKPSLLRRLRMERL